MSVVRIGATKQYSDNWDNIFSGGKSSSSTKKAGKKSAEEVAEETAKVAKKAAGKKRPAGAKRKRK